MPVEAGKKGGRAVSQDGGGANGATVPSHKPRASPISKKGVLRKLHANSATQVGAHAFDPVRQAVFTSNR